MSLQTRLTDFAAAVGADIKSLNAQIAGLGGGGGGGSAPAIPYATLRSWYAGLANRRNEQVSVGIIGDSTVEGYDLANFLQTLPMQMAYAFRSQFSVPLLDVINPGAGGRGFIGAPTNPTNFTYWPWVLSGGTGTGTLSGYGPAGKCWVMSAGNKVTLPMPGATSFDLIQTLGPAGAANGAYYKIDSQAAVNFNTYAAAVTANKITVNSPVTNQVEIGVNSASLYFAGLREYIGDETKGVQVHNLGQTGSTTQVWVNAAAGAYGGGAWQYHLPNFNLDLLIIQLGGNDKIGGIAVSTFKANMISMIASIRAQGVTCPIIISMVYDAVTGSFPWSDYVTAAKQIQTSDATVGVVDHSARMYAFSSTVDPAGLYLPASPPHESARGAALMAETFVAALSPT